GGEFNICLWEPTIPENDSCANAIPLTVSESCQMLNFSNRFSGDEGTSIAPKPTCGFYQGGDVWFKTVMPQSGVMRIETETTAGARAQNVLYSGTCGGFTQIICNQ